MPQRAMVRNPAPPQKTKGQLQLTWKINSSAEISQCWKSSNQVIHALISKRSSHMRSFRILPGTAITYFQKLKVHSCDNKIKKINKKKITPQNPPKKQTKTKPTEKQNSPVMTAMLKMQLIDCVSSEGKIWQAWNASSYSPFNHHSVSNCLHSWA